MHVGEADGLDEPRRTTRRQLLEAGTVLGLAAAVPWIARVPPVAAQAGVVDVETLFPALLDVVAAYPTLQASEATKAQAVREFLAFYAAGDDQLRGQVERVLQVVDDGAPNRSFAAASLSSRTAAIVGQLTRSEAVVPGQLAPPETALQAVMLAAQALCPYYTELDPIPITGVLN